jgi:hypothetical protein
MVWGTYYWWCINNCVPLTKASYDDYTEHFSVSLRKLHPLILLGVAPGRRVWWCGFLSCCWSCLCKNLDSCHDLVHDMQFLKYTLILCWLIWVAGCECWWCSWLSLIKCSWYLLFSSPGGLPCTSLVLGTSSLPALHLLGAWLAPCCGLILFKWPCLLNFGCWVWFGGDNSPWCSVHEQGELCWFW